MSYRLAETMSFGGIPVVVSDYISLPFPDLIQWKEFIVIVAESQILEVPDILRSISADERRLMRERVCEVYEQYFATLARVMLGAMQSFTHRSQSSWGDDPKLHLNGFVREPWDVKLPTLTRKPPVE